MRLLLLFGLTVVVVVAFSSACRWLLAVKSVDDVRGEPRDANDNAGDDDILRVALASDDDDEACRTENAEQVFKNATAANRTRHQPRVDVVVNAIPMLFIVSSE